MTAFDAAVAIILNSEGKWSNDPSDAGGKTKWGISEGAGTLKEAKKRGLVPQDRRIEDLSVNEARKIYRVIFWDAVSGDELPPSLAFVAFDMAVNPGVGVAIPALQGALGVKTDGIIGAVTLAAARKAKPDAIDKMLADRARYYFQRTIKVPANLRFLDGWLVRCMRTARQAAEMETT